MVDYREIIRLHSLNFSNAGIANSIRCSRNTVSEVLKLAETHALDWPIPEALKTEILKYCFIPIVLPAKEEEFLTSSMFIRNSLNLE